MAFEKAAAEAEEAIRELASDRPLLDRIRAACLHLELSSADVQLLNEETQQPLSSEWSIARNAELPAPVRARAVAKVISYILEEWGTIQERKRHNRGDNQWEPEPENN